MNINITPYLIFDGQCEAAFKFYEQCLRGKLEAMLPFEGAPGCEQMPPEMNDKIMHARLVVGDFALMGSDNNPQFPYEGIKGSSVALGLDNAAEAERIFNALAEGGTVQMPLQQTFWAFRFGMATDRFGVPWMINCEKEA